MFIGSPYLGLWLIYLLMGRELPGAGVIVGILVVAFFLSYIVAVAISLRQTLKTVRSMTEG